MRSVFLDRINHKGKAKKAEIKWHMWVEELIGDKSEKVSVLCE